MTRARWFAVLCAAAMSVAQADELTLVYTGNLDGELEPCGCSQGGDLGGIKRQAQMLDKLRAETPALIAISSGGLITAEVPQDKLKSEFILRGVRELRYDAIGVQPQDLSYGPDFTQGRDLPWVVSNVGDTSLFATERMIVRDARRVAFFQWLEPLAPAMKNSALAAQEDPQPLQKMLREARAKGDLVMLGTTLPLVKAQKIFNLADVDILLVKSKYEEYGEPQRVGHTLVLQPGSRGMRLAKIVLELDAKGAIARWRHDVIPLPKEVGEAPRLRDWYADYNDQVKADYEARVDLRKKLQSQPSPYVGAKVCGECHAAEFEKWKTTKHARAFYALQDVNKAFDPNCIGCHTVGFEKEGFIDPALTEHLTHVQCENCHGAGKRHAESAGIEKTPNHGWPRAQVCAQCHEHKHSPDFDLEKRWPRIAHGKTAP